MKTFRCAIDASIETGVSVTHIRSIANGSKPAKSKFSWRYSQEPINPNEVWKTHPLGVECSNLGRVKAKHFASYGQSERNGYKRIKIKAKTYSVHRLIAEAWLENPNKKPQVNHIDFDRGNNDVTNLEWVTPSENIVHRFKNKK